ncbi:MAG TPA: zinc-binding dehydrogenase [bacterium]|nr:zinc-binding dehydrogenase [bacterium]
MPPDVDPHEMAALGLVAVTAYEGLPLVGPPEGRRIIVTGAAGGVGSAAIGVAKAQGAFVVSIVSRTEQAEYVQLLGADETVVRPRDSTGGPLGIEEADGVLDAVGGELFGPCVGLLRPDGTPSLVGAAGGNNVRFDADQLMQGVTLTGYSSESVDGPALRRAVVALADWLRRGLLRPPARRVLPLSDAASAHAILERGGGRGRFLLVPP